MPGSVSAPVRATPTSAASDASRARSPIASSARFWSVMSRAGTPRTAGRLPRTPGSSPRPGRPSHPCGECRVWNATGSPASCLRAISSIVAGVDRHRSRMDAFPSVLPACTPGFTRLAVHVRTRLVSSWRKNASVAWSTKMRNRRSLAQGILSPLMLGDVSGHVHRPAELALFVHERRGGNKEVAAQAVLVYFFGVDP